MTIEEFIEKRFNEETFLRILEDFNHVLGGAYCQDVASSDVDEILTEYLHLKNKKDKKYNIGDIVKVISDGSKYDGYIGKIKGIICDDYDLGFDDEFFNEEELCNSNSGELEAYFLGARNMHNNELKNYDKYKSFLIKKACEWLSKNYICFNGTKFNQMMLDKFKQAMEE